MKAVIFDLDGTLLNTIDTIAHYGNEALSRFGFQTASAEEYKHFVGNGALKLIERALNKSGEWTRADFDNVYTLYNRLYDAEPLYLTSPYEGITDLLKRLRAEGTALGILSNKPDSAVSGIVKHFFAGLYDLASGGRSGIPLKPDPYSALAMLSDLGAPREEAFFVGDSDIDILTGKAAGLHTIGVSWGFRGEEELKKAGADYICRSADEIFDIVKSI